MNQENVEAVETLSNEILKYIEKTAKERAKGDITFKSIIKNITPKGYVILDESGNERTVPCCLPGLELKIMQTVWVKEPMGRLSDMHICGVAGKERR